VKIEVFIKKEEVVTGQAIMGRPISDGVATHYCTTHDTFKTEKFLTAESKRALEEAKRKAKELNAQIVVFDLSTFKGQLAARLKGVKSPTWKITE